MQSPFRRAASAPAAAPMPMLSFPGKRPLHFTEDTSAAEKDADLGAFMRARRLVVSSSERATGRAGGGEVAADLRAYLREIEAVAPRFDAAVMRAAAAPATRLGFQWLDAVAGGRHRSASQCHTSLVTERAVALVALAAESARAAAAEDRRGPDGIRRACAALCDAAGALREGAAGAPEQPSRMSPAYAAALESLMLAQALECYFELAVAGGRPPAVCSAIARQVSLDYDQVHAALESPELRKQTDRSWAAHAQAKAAYFRAEACLRAARARRAEGDAGVAIARLRQALASLKSGPLRKAAAPVQDAAKWLKKEVEAELAGAEQDNCRIYYMRVPADDALAELPGLRQRLVRPTPLENILHHGADGAAAAAAGG